MLPLVDSIRNFGFNLGEPRIVDDVLSSVGWQDVRLPRLSIPEKGDSSSQPATWEGIGSVVVTAAATCAVFAGVRSVVSMISWRQSLRDYESGDAAAGPTPLPLFGNMLQLRRSYYKTLYDHVNEPASVFWVLSTPFVVVNDSAAACRVLGGAGGLYTKPKYFGYRSKAVRNAVEKEKSKVISESAEYDADGDASRVALQKMIVNSFDDIKLAMDQLMQRLAKETTENSVSRRDPLRAARETVIGLNLQVLFGIPSEGREKETERIAEMIGFAGTEFAQRMVNPLKVFYDFVSNVRYVRDVVGLIKLGREFAASLDKILPSNGDEREESSSGLSWVHAWVGKVGKIGKLGKVTGLLMASSQTVPLTAVWMLHLISKDNETRGKVKDELLRMGVFSVNDLKFEDIDKLVVADAVVKETLRLYPPFPLIQREAQENDVLGGITLPKGTPVYIVPWLLHRNPSFWSDPHTFKPSRFMEFDNSIGDCGTSWVYVPFGRGSRMCAGSRLAITELKVLLTTAVLSYDLDTSASSESADSAFPPLGMIPSGVDIQARKSSF